MTTSSPQFNNNNNEETQAYTMTSSPLSSPKMEGVQFNYKRTQSPQAIKSQKAKYSSSLFKWTQELMERRSSIDSASSQDSSSINENENDDNEKN
ncbi:uncharacterized protein IL334_002403 [Kwoniella shivajii]|uniref:Uncharacterized protein n=1 Tax=Kwoniella shivajii TaxID=564305 RepID=A0ABZ1CUZ9_9TREE|nr:hypothetical protein IL334_002403 [Kwoniella shivajii]